MFQLSRQLCYNFFAKESVSGLHLERKSAGQFQWCWDQPQSKKSTTFPLGPWIPLICVIAIQTNGGQESLNYFKEIQLQKWGAEFLSGYTADPLESTVGGWPQTHRALSPHNCIGIVSVLQRGKACPLLSFSSTHTPIIFLPCSSAHGHLCLLLVC